MIYDRALKICELTDGTPLSGELTPVSIHLYAQLEVFYKRYWEAIIAGTQIDTMVQIPGPTEIVAGQYCILEDNRVYTALMRITSPSPCCPCIAPISVMTRRWEVPRNDGARNGHRVKGGDQCSLRDGSAQGRDGLCGVV